MSRDPSVGGGPSDAKALLPSRSLHYHMRGRKRFQNGRWRDYREAFSASIADSLRLPMLKHGCLCYDADTVAFPISRTRRLALLWMAGAAALPAAVPVKLGVTLDRPSIPAGGAVRVRIELLDAGNRPAAAPKALKIQLQARLPSGKVAPLTAVAIAAGQSSVETSVPAPGSGLVYIWAKHPELLLGGAFVQVKPAGPRPPAGSHHDLLFTPPHAAPPPAPAPAANSGLQIDLRYSPERTFLADGKDSAAILAFLSGVSSTDIRLNIFDGSGSLKPTPLMIPRGQSQAVAAVTSDHPGTFSIEYLGSSPSAQFAGNSPLKIQFVPPVTRLDLQASPPSVSMLDTADLIATLTDDRGRAVQTDQPRHVSFAIDTGQGGFLQKDVAIQPGSFQARTGFQPEWPGKVVISAATANLMTVTAAVQVSLPVALLIFRPQAERWAACSPPPPDAGAISRAP